MGICLSLCTGNPPTWTSAYRGTVTTTSQQNLVLSIPSPIGPKQYVAILSISTKRSPPQEGNNPMQIPQMGFGQGGEKV